MFCPIRSGKTKKTNQIKNNEVILSNNGHNEDNQNATSAPYRYVTTEFHAIATDELSVLPGDVVLYEFTDRSSNGDWAHVICLKTYKRGFVPSEILSIEPRRHVQCKKKLPRSIKTSDDHLNHNTRLVAHTNSPQSNNEDNARLNHHNNRHPHHHHHLHDQKQKFGIAHSLQGSSGKQSLQKYPDLRQINSPAYCNVRATESHYERYELEYRLFHRDDYGLFMVTNNFVAREENDLNVRPGDYVYVLNKEDEDWFWVRRTDDLAEGFVPSRFLCDYEQVKSILNKGNSTITMKSSNHNDFHTYINHGPERESLPADQQSSLLQHI